MIQLSQVCAIGRSASPELLLKITLIGVAESTELPVTNLKTVRVSIIERLLSKVAVHTLLRRIEEVRLLHELENSARCGGQTNVE